MDWLDDSQKKMFDSIACDSNDYFFIYSFDKDEMIWSANTVRDFDIPSWHSESGLKAWSGVVHVDDRKEQNREFEMLKNGLKDSFHCRSRIRTRRLEYIWMSLRGHVENWENGKPRYLFGTYSRLMQNEMLDSVTSLRDLGAARMDEQSLIQRKRYTSIMKLDLANFKQINKKFSYIVGNEILKIVSRNFEQCCHESATLYRAEGDHFLVIYPGAGKSQMQAVFEEMKRKASRIMISEKQSVSLTICGAMVTYPQDGEDIATLDSNLEFAMDVAKKRENRGVLVPFSDKLKEDVLYRMRLVDALEDSVETEYKGFTIFYQPIVSASDDHRLLSCEALLRWQDESYPNTYPDTFIPILEDTGLIREVGKWVLRTAIAQAKEWKKIIPDLNINVNISYLQLEEAQFADYVLEELRRQELESGSLVLELTESCAIKNFQKLRDTFTKLKEEGVQIAFDDFGTGYASIEILRQLPADWVKLDHNFVSQSTNSQYDRNIISHLIDLSHSLDIRVCVEGVETEECCRLVQEKNTDLIQGYYFSRPIPREEFEQKFIIGATT
ncbi:MAG: GGDEF and EAL domain-containing protein [Clostridiales bacterium]|nr:GGDEF and EAL domain-containing protein [Clostridiales bacterium]